MARKKVPTQPTYTAWEDVDNALKLIAQLEGSLTELQVDLNRQLASAKEKADKLAQPIHNKIALLEKDVKDFVSRHREELDGKTKKLTFGKTGYRLTTKLVIPKDIRKEDFIATLRRQGLTDCIKTEESILRDVLKTHTKDEVLATGAYLNTKDEFWYELDQETLVPKE